MLSLSNFVSQPQCNSISKILYFYPKTPHTHFTFSTKTVKFLKFKAVFAKIPSGFCLSASKNGNEGQSNVLEVESFDGEEEEDFGFLDEDFDDGDELDGDIGDEDEVIIPIRNMKKWVENKPRGFGEGKEYDTSVEDKLMEEIEQSRKAQLANVNKLKNSPENPSSKEQVEKSKDVQEGYRVRLVNLPKKKNIHKDLQMAFKEVPGLITITPAVFGNKKTRDPVCKGFAFVNFKSEEEALRFVQIFSGQSISFGKVQKQIRCELLNSGLANSTYKQSVDKTYSAPRLEAPSLVGNSDANIPPVNSLKETASNVYEDVSEEHLLETSNLGDVLEERDGSSISEVGNYEKLETSDLSESSDARKDESANSSSPLKPKKKSQENAKRGTPKRKKEKSSKLTIPGSANRLKVKEKAILTDVFSKYVLNNTIASNVPS